MYKDRKILPLLSWASFDFAETIFSANILSVFFPLWLTNVLGGKPFHYSIVYSSSLFVSVILAIIMGKHADKSAMRKKLFLISVTISSVCLLMLSFSSTLTSALIIFFFVNLFYQQSLVLYNSLLISVSDKENRSFSSGVGVAIGYVGGAAGLYLVSKVSSTETFAFVLVAFAFFLFSLPTGFFVKEAPFKAVSGVSIRGILKDKSFLLFILSCLFLTEAAHTIIIFMSIYLDKVYGLDRQNIVIVIASAAVVTAVASPLIGKLSDKVGAAKIFNIVFPAWSIAFCIFPFVPVNFVYVMGITFGLLLGTVWTTIRPVLIGLSPKEEVATRFAFLSISERMAAIIGPLWWSFIAEKMDCRNATLSLALFPLVGWVIYRMHIKKHRGRSYT
ncbi:MAG: MFS transporter [Nitrospirae bacterium]|nr:MFS transporter [Nitrospirota bacterium]